MSIFGNLTFPFYPPRVEPDPHLSPYSAQQYKMDNILYFINDVREDIREEILDYAKSDNCDVATLEFLSNVAQQLPKYYIKNDDWRVRSKKNIYTVSHFRNYLNLAKEGVSLNKIQYLYQLSEIYSRTYQAFDENTEIGEQHINTIVTYLEAGQMEEITMIYVLKILRDQIEDACEYFPEESAIDRLLNPAVIHVLNIFITELNEGTLLESDLKEFMRIIIEQGCENKDLLLEVARAMCNYRTKEDYTEDMLKQTIKKAEEETQMFRVDNELDEYKEHYDTIRQMMCNIRIDEPTAEKVIRLFKDSLLGRISKEEEIKQVKTLTGNKIYEDDAEKKSPEKDLKEAETLYKEKHDKDKDIATENIKITQR